MTKPWDGDADFRDDKIKAVTKCDKGYEITKGDGWLFFLSEPSPVEPKPGMKIRLYGNIRGVFIENQMVYYRTAAEDREYQDIVNYGKDAAELLKRWDDGRSVWTVEMGGIGPGYEQSIQIAAFEFLRALLEGGYSVARWDADATAGKEDWEKIRAKVNPLIAPLGLSGAQHGSAQNVAAIFFRHGPVKAMQMAPQDRRILVSRKFPTLERSAA